MAQQTFEELVAAVKQAESRGKRYKDDGKTLTTSPKGALGEMQVMPTTITDPGFGVTPARDKSPDEIARVGVDYLQAMKSRYGDTDRALIAYNWGPGSTDKWIAAGADPKKLPEETRTYVQRVKGFLGKDVSRETVAKKEREPLPASLPPMAEAPQATSAKATTVAKLDMANMPASYKAAFALAALADAQDEEEDRAFNENKQTETETFFANYKPVNHLASLDLSVTPVMMAEGGDPKSAKSLMDKFKNLAFEYKKDPIAFMREYKVPTSPMGLGLNAGYATYKHITGKDPLLDLQKELSQRLNPEIDTGDSDSVPMSVGLPPVRRAEGSPEEGEDVSKPFFGNPNISRQAGQARRIAAIRNASYRDELGEAKDIARKGEAYQELEKYLQSRGEMPNITIGRYLPEGTHGVFFSDKANIGTGNIKVNKNLHEMYMPATIAHEVTHAADRQMEQQAMEQGLFGKSNQFTEAYRKMVGPEGRNRTQLLRKRYPEFEEDHRYYRSRPDEVAAHGIGAYSGPAMQDRAPRHVDATAATEFRILMDLAQRNVDKGPKGLERIPAFFRKIVPYADGGEVEGEQVKFSTQAQPARGVAPPPPATRSAKELDAYIKALNPGAKISYFPEGGGTLGYVNSDSPNSLNIQRSLSPQRDEETKLHELEHSLTFRAGDPLGRPKIKAVDNNYQAYYMLGSWQPMSQFTKNMVENKEKLEKFFGRPLNNAYFQPETLQSVKKQQGDTSALFDEQMATLSALEQITGKSLTRDPEMKKLFPSVKVMSVYDALTGPRQTRMDPRDLPPSTPQPAYIYRDNPVTQFLHKHLLSDNFYPYQKPVRRANGGDAEPTAEEIAAASTPAFIAQKSGIGRKQGNISKALKSGEALTETAKGLTMLPQNIAGAPVDLATMAMRPFGYNVEKPFMGSDYLKEKSRSAGLAFKPSDDPTLAGFFGAGDLASNLVNPAGVTRAGVQAAGKTGEAAKMLARDFQGYNQQLAVPGASYAIRNKGTPFIMRPEGTTVFGRIRPEMNEADAHADLFARMADTESGAPSDNPALAEWVRSKVGAYLRRDFGTEQDQMVQAAEKGQKLHFMSPRFLEDDPHSISKYLATDRETEGFPKAGFAKTAKGQEVEAVVDSSIYPVQLQDLSDKVIPSALKQFKSTQPQMRLSEMSGYATENLKLEVLVDQMKKMFKEKEFKAYGETTPMPKEYILTEDTLKGLTPAQASNRVANKMEWVDKKRAELAGVAISKDPQIVSHSYDNGSKWISPADLADYPNHAEMVKDIGCAGGWCTDKSNFALDYGSGDNRLNILLDKKFEPRVQLTLNNPTPSMRDFANYVYQTTGDKSIIEDLSRSAYGWHTGMDSQIEDRIKAMPEYQDFLKQNQTTKNITEIKGRFNNSDLTKSPYLKQVQDFVKRQGPDLQSVSNLDGINMVDARAEIVKNVLDKPELVKKFNANYMNKLLELNDNSYYVDAGELLGLLKKVEEYTPPNAARAIQMNLFQTKATGGMIERQPTDNRRYL